MYFVVLPGLSLLGLFFLHYQGSVSQDLFLPRFHLLSDPLGLVEVIGRDRPEYDIRSSYIKDLSRVNAHLPQNPNGAGYPPH